MDSGQRVCVCQVQSGGIIYSVNIPPLWISIVVHFDCLQNSVCIPLQVNLGMLRTLRSLARTSYISATFKQALKRQSSFATQLRVPIINLSSYRTMSTANQDLKVTDPASLPNPLGEGLYIKSVVTSAIIQCMPDADESRTAGCIIIG